MRSGDQNTFSAFVFDLTSERPVEIIGDHVHGWLISVVSCVPGLADRLHAPVRGKPFSLAFGTHKLGYWIRVSSLDRQLSNFVASFAARRVDIGPVFLTCRRKSGPGQHVLAGATSAGDLWSRWMHEESPAGRVRMKFATPTAFALDQHRVTAQPVAKLVFRSLIKTWNENAEAKINVHDADALLDAVRISSTDVRVVSGVRLRSHQQPGFVGQCEYVCRPDTPLRTKQLLHLLAEFAFYSGVGLKRTMGMGMTVPSFQ